MNKRTWVLMAATVLLAGCAHELTSDERLDRETTRADSLKSTTASELGRLRCDDMSVDLNKARDANRSEEDRLTAYSELYGQLKSRTLRFDEAMSRNPDLAFQEGSQELVASRDGCVQSVADVRHELETLIREIMQVLIVEDVRSGQNVKVARIDFAPLRAAIDKLELDDRDFMLSKISTAEKQVDVKVEGRKRSK